MGPVDNACHTGPRPVWRIIDGCPISLLLFSVPGRYWPHGLTISTIWHRKVRVRPNRYEPIFAIFARGQFQNSFDWSAYAQRRAFSYTTSCIFIRDCTLDRVSMHLHGPHANASPPHMKMHPSLCTPLRILLILVHIDFKRAYFSVPYCRYWQPVGPISTAYIK